MSDDATDKALEDNTQGDTGDTTHADAASADSQGDTLLAGALSAKDDATKSAAPEAYEEFTWPEGVAFPEAQLGTFKELAKGLGLSQEQAQKLVDFQGQLTDAELDRVAAARTSELAKWERELKSDPELGGANFQATMNEAKRAVQRFGTPELAEAITERGLDGHPALVRLFKSIDDALGEDKLVTGKSADATRKLSDVEVFYPETK